jgi:hypothetical protein
MRLAQDDEMVHALAPDRSDQPFGKAILPRRGWCRRLVPDAHGTQSACDNGAVDPIPIANEVLRGIIPRKRLGYLTRNPFCRRVCCDVGQGRSPVWFRFVPGRRSMRDSGADSARIALRSQFGSDPPTSARVYDRQRPHSLHEPLLARRGMFQRHQIWRAHYAVLEIMPLKSALGCDPTFSCLSELFPINKCNFMMLGQVVRGH